MIRNFIGALTASRQTKAEIMLGFIFEFFYFLSGGRTFVLTMNAALTFALLFVDNLEKYIHPAHSQL